MEIFGVVLVCIICSFLTGLVVRLLTFSQAHDAYLRGVAAYHGHDQVCVYDTGSWRSRFWDIGQKMEERRYSR